MLSALKKWAKGGNENAKGSMPSGVRAMGQALQRKFARGIQFNMKIVIKGDRNTGKSCLFQRLQGKSFNEQYIPTNEIQVASIHWNYRTTDDVVKVEVWDVVDKGRSKKPLRDSLKLENDKTEPSSDGAFNTYLTTEDELLEGEKDGNVLDAEFVDVFKGAHGVMMIMDITKPWTFQYIERELPKVPPHLPVLVLASHRDMGEHRLVQTEEVIAFIENLERPDRSPPVHYAEASMKNSFGLKYIHKFLNLPFLLLQRETLLKQLQVNSEDMESTLEELQIHKESEEQDYEKFVSILERKKKEHEAKKAAVAAAAAAAAAGEDQPTTPPGSPSDNPSTDNTVKTPSSTPSSQGSSFKSRISRVAAALSPTEKETSEEVIPRSSSGLSPADIDEFVPEDELDAGFLDENGAGGKKRPSKPAVKKPVAQVPFEQDKSDESDSDTDSRNPMVAGFVEDIDSEDDSVPPVVTNHINKVMNNGADHRKKPAKPVTPVTVELTSSEEEQEQEENEEDEELKKRDQRDEEKEKASKAKQRDSAPLKLEMPVKSVPVSDAAVEDVGVGIETVDDWLNSPDSEPKIPFSTSSDSKNYTVRKVDVNSPPAKSAPIPLDEWDKFMAIQLQPQTRGATTPSGALIDMDEDEDNEQETNGESKSRKKQEHKSGEKSRTKHKHRKHKDKSAEGGEEGEKSKDKERRRSRHKEGSEKEKERRKSKDEESDKKKKQKRRHSRAKSEEEFQEGVTYEEL